MMSVDEMTFHNVHSSLYPLCSEAHRSHGRNADARGMTGVYPPNTLSAGAAISIMDQGRSKVWTALEVTVICVDGLSTVYCHMATPASVLKTED
jgi:hypothetical protein